MKAKTKIAIIGFGNVARGVVASLGHNPDLELAAIFSRSPERVKNQIKSSEQDSSMATLKDIPIYSISDTDALQNCDVAILCGGSKNDLPEQGPHFAQFISTVDSFDNHSKVPEYFAQMDNVAKKSGKVSIISAGWDPGTFSLERLMGTVIIPNARTYGFYGLGEKGGLSMGHSDAIRTIEGVQDARQYTHAKLETIERIRSGENPSLTPRDMHWRECFVVVKKEADKTFIEDSIKKMPGYFEPYDTIVHFVGEQELVQNHAGFPHDGLVLGSGTIGDNTRALIEYQNVWESNPTATAHILVAHARAAARLQREGNSGAYTILDIAPAYLSPKTRDELLAKFV